VTLAEVAARMRKFYRFGKSRVGYEELRYNTAKLILKLFEADPEFALPAQHEALLARIEAELKDWDKIHGNAAKYFARRLREVMTP